MKIKEIDYNGYEIKLYLNNNSTYDIDCFYIRDVIKPELVCNKFSEGLVKKRLQVELKYIFDDIYCDYNTPQFNELYNYIWSLINIDIYREAIIDIITNTNKQKQIKLLKILNINNDIIENIDNIEIDDIIRECNFKYNEIKKLYYKIYEVEQ